MAGDLDLYGHRYWPRAVAVGAAVALVAGLLGYRWVTTATPVTRDRALDTFRSAQKAEGPSKKRSDRRAKPAPTKPKRPQRERDRTERRASPVSHRAAAAPATVASTDRSAPTEESPHRERRTEPRAPRPPKEGVYSWATEGYEEAGGARRSFPKESQRIITRSHSGWNQHHYFSEQRETWTRFRLSREGAAIAYQRNKVVFGPITEDSAITFSPPMLVGPSDRQVGMRWAGEWTGDTYGDYDGRVFEHGRMTIGGTSVEVWGIEIDVRLRGEQSGNILAKVWLAPEHSLTVREDYIQDVKADVGRYHAEWSMTLKSLDPQT